MPAQLVNALVLSGVIVFVINRSIAFLSQRKAIAAAEKASSREM